MEWIRFFGATAALLGLMYAATVIELTVPAGDFVPSVVALAVTLAVCVTGRSAIFWAALGGLLIDATSQGRLGPFLIAYSAITAAIASMTASGRPSGWTVTALSFALGAVQPVVIALVTRLTGTVTVNPADVVIAAASRGGATGWAATVALMALIALQRIAMPTASTAPLTLSNRWTMITE